MMLAGRLLLPSGLRPAVVVMRAMHERRIALLPDFSPLQRLLLAVRLQQLSLHL